MVIGTTAVTLGRYGKNVDSYCAFRDCRTLVNEEVPDRSCIRHSYLVFFLILTLYISIEAKDDRGTLNEFTYLIRDAVYMYTYVAKWGLYRALIVYSETCMNIFDSIIWYSFYISKALAGDVLQGEQAVN